MAFSPAPLGTALVDNRGYTTASWGVWFNQTLYAKILQGVTGPQVIAALGYTPYSTANPANYISGITGAMVNTALGYVPYPTSNPLGFISGIDGGMIATALGYAPLGDAPVDGTTYGRMNGAWVAAGGGGGTRATASVSTGTIASGATASVTITLAKTTTILQLATSYPAWVRIYTTAAALAADASRPSTAYPIAGAGVVCDSITSAGALAVWQDPTSVFANNDSPVTGTAYVAITNLDIAPQNIALTVTHLSMES